MEDKVQLPAGPMESFGKEIDLLLDNSFLPLLGDKCLQSFYMVIDDGVVKALDMKPKVQASPATWCPTSSCSSEVHRQMPSCLACPVLARGPAQNHMDLPNWNLGHHLEE